MSDYPFETDDPEEKRALNDYVREVESFITDKLDGCDLYSSGMRAFVAAEVVNHMYECGFLVLP